MRLEWDVKKLLASITRAERSCCIELTLEYESPFYASKRAVLATCCRDYRLWGKQIVPMLGRVASTLQASKAARHTDCSCTAWTRESRHGRESIKQYDAHNAETPIR
jgi:hypothetical protein